MLVCDVCGSRDIRQEATIMLNPNEPFPEKTFAGDFFWCDYYLCMSCNEAGECDATCQPIEDPHHKEKKDG